MLATVFSNITASSTSGIGSASLMGIGLPFFFAVVLFAGGFILLGMVLMRSFRSYDIATKEIASLFAASPFPLLFLKRDGTIGRMNPAAQQLLETVGVARRRVGILEPYKSVLAHANRGGKHVCEDITFIDQREKREYQLRVRPVLVGDRIIGWMIGFHDVTREHHLEQAKRDFVALVSHELRTPLSGLNWTIEFLTEDGAGKISEEQRQYLQQMSEAVEGMVDLVSNLLLITKAEGGESGASAVAVDLGVLTQHVLREFTGSCTEQQIRVETHILEHLPPVFVDPSLAHQVLDILLANAVGYNRQHGSLSVSVTGDEHAVQVKIQDTGLGIPVAQQHLIFQKFFRGDNVVRKETEGKGLGLYIARTIVEASGGTIWFTSTEGEGSTFVVSFPVYQAPKTTQKKTYIR
ncbi:HAMP domain-containing histidine kinase [Patescibacteria group bacterium]|nr:HAMP domain-containing histidine kinase [Patescibacteria group bacterium]